MLPIIDVFICPTNTSNSDQIFKLYQMLILMLKQANWKRDLLGRLIYKCILFLVIFCTYLRSMPTTCRQVLGLKKLHLGKLRKQSAQAQVWLQLFHAMLKIDSLC